MPAAKEQIRQTTSENNIRIVSDVYTFLKDSFKDILQEIMEVGLDADLGYKKIKRDSCTRLTKGMGISPRPLRASWRNYR